MWDCWIKDGGDKCQKPPHSNKNTSLTSDAFANIYFLLIFFYLFFSLFSILLLLFGVKPSKRSQGQTWRYVNTGGWSAAQLRGSLLLGRHCPLAKTHWTETENTHPSLYVADNSSWMASSWSGGFCLSMHIFVCVSIWLGDYSSLCSVFTCVYLFVKGHQERCNTLVSQQPRLSSLALLYIPPWAFWDTSRLLCECVTRSSCFVPPFFTPDGGERRFWGQIKVSSVTHTLKTQDSRSLSLSPFVHLFLGAALPSISPLRINI